MNSGAELSLTHWDTKGWGEARGEAKERSSWKPKMDRSLPSIHAIEHGAGLKIADQDRGGPF